MKFCIFFREAIIAQFDFNRFAAGLGIEPRYQASKARVLPLDDPAMRQIQD